MARAQRTQESTSVAIRQRRQAAVAYEKGPSTMSENSVLEYLHECAEIQRVRVTLRCRKCGHEWVVSLGVSDITRPQHPTDKATVCRECGGRP